VLATCTLGTRVGATSDLDQRAQGFRLRAHGRPPDESPDGQEADNRHRRDCAIDGRLGQPNVYPGRRVVATPQPVSHLRALFRFRR
jgi:hypothetical protein